MRNILIFIFAVFYLPFLFKKAESQDVGIDSDEDAQSIYNKSYSEHQTGLEAKIFWGYNPRTRPVKNASMPTIVDVHWHVIHASISQKEQTMTLHGHIYMRWFDEFLVWDPKDFNGIHYARVKKWQVWQPKIKVSNSASGLGSAFDFSTSAHVIIQMVEKDRAKVEMYPTFSIKVGCSFDFSDYPFDSNKCSVNLFSTATMAEVQLQNLYSLPPTLSFGWEEQKMKRIISDFKINNVSCSSFYYSGGNVSKTAPVTGFDLGSTWSMLSVNVLFERFDPLYQAAIVLPCIISAAIIHCSYFILKKQNALFVHVSLLIIQFVYLQDMTTPLPLVISKLPSVVRLFAFCIILNCVNSLINAIFVGLSYTRFPVPFMMRKIYVVDDWLPKYMIDEKMRIQNIEKENEDKKKKKMVIKKNTFFGDSENQSPWEKFNTTFRAFIGIIIIPFFLIAFILILFFHF